MRHAVRHGSWAVVLLLAACSFSKSDHPQACHEDSDCAAGERCLARGYCLAKQGQGASGVDAGSHADGSARDGSQGQDGGARDGGAGDAGGDGGMTGMACVSGTSPEDCYDGPAATKDVGVCRGGQRACIDGKYTPCLGQVLPSDESCNGKDDNCDGIVDEFDMAASCKTAMKGVCEAGALVCRGNYAVCEPVHTPGAEVCNGRDDDCNGMVDDIASSQCYPQDETGCTPGSDGKLVCKGLCQPGHSACSAGKDACPDAVKPVAESCTQSGQLAADEDCDGKIDEGCTCVDGDMRSCYSGPMGTDANAPCHDGTQTCTSSAGGGAWGECAGEVTPGRETCDNLGQDDDCDGTDDNFPDIPGLGEPCIDDSQQGLCRAGTWQCPSGASEPACVGGAPKPELCDAIDQDCDGNPINGFDLKSDSHNCGKCGNACGKEQTCCNGVCTSIADYRDDPNNCGGCGIQCGTGRYCCWNDCLPGRSTLGACACAQDCGDKSCCGTGCYDLQNDAHNCGQCGNDCTSGGTLKGQCCNGHCQSLCGLGF